MSNNVIDAAMLKACVIAGARNLDAHKAYINELNVFPVPDGDTGTNMSMTVMSAARAVDAVEEPDIAGITKAMSSGALRGARGNSGVIMSQLIRGFCKTVGQAGAIDAELSAKAFSKAVETAYKAVMKPKEGTILTVARGIAERVEELAPVTPDLGELLRQGLVYGNEVLEKTPELLPVLKEAGVVDSGGQGLVTFLEGALEAVEGRYTVTGIDGEAGDPEVTGNLFRAAGAGSVAYGTGTGTAGTGYAAAGALSRAGGALSAEVPREHISTDDIRFGYCTEFIVNLREPLTSEEVLEFKSFLESIGDSIVCVDDDEMIKVHVHTNHPGLAFEKGLEIGSSLSRMKVDNMREEHEERLIKNASKLAAMGRQPGQPGAEPQGNGTVTKGPQDMGESSSAVGDAVSTVRADAPGRDADAMSGCGGTGYGTADEADSAAAKGARGDAAADADGNVSAAVTTGAPRKPCAFIAVCTGSGFRDIFTQLGAACVIEGGQTMNPSTDDILKAVDEANAEEVFILPNNKNIILASEQAARINQEVNVHVVPTKTIPQGIAAMINYTEGMSTGDNMDAMMEGVAAIRTGELTYAVRHTMIDGVDIKEGDIIAIGDRGILATGEILNSTALEMVDRMVDADSTLVTIYVGEGIDDESAGMLADAIVEKYPELDVETERGEQPVYYYIISVE